MQNKLLMITDWQLHTHVIIHKSPELCNCTLYSYKIRCQYNHLQYNIEWNLMKIHFGIINSNDSSNYNISQYDIYIVVYYSATSRIDSGFKINMYYLIQYIYLLFSNGALTGNYSTFEPSSLPPKLKKKKKKTCTMFDQLWYPQTQYNSCSWEAHMSLQSVWKRSLRTIKKYWKRLMISCCHEILLTINRSLSALSGDRDRPQSWLRV